MLEAGLASVKWAAHLISSAEIFLPIIIALVTNAVSPSLPTSSFVCAVRALISPESDLHSSPALRRAPSPVASNFQLSQLPCLIPIIPPNIIETESRERPTQETRPQGRNLIQRAPHTLPADVRQRRPNVVIRIPESTDFRLQPSFSILILAHHVAPSAPSQTIAYPGLPWQH